MIEDSLILKASHLLGVQNCLADHLSRLFSKNHEWFLNMTVLRISVLTVCGDSYDEFVRNLAEHMSSILFLSSPQSSVHLRFFPVFL